MDLEQWDLGRFLLLKSNGTSLYATKDIALAHQKAQDFPTYDKSLYIVATEQNHHFAQLFKTLELARFEAEKLQHISYGFLDLKNGKMSSRMGNVILYTDLRDQMIEKAKETLATRNISEEEKEKTAYSVAFGAMKFLILLQDAEKKILFDEEQALSFEGET